MRKITFYDSKRNEVMVLTNVGFRSPTFLLNLSLTHSIYRAGLPIVVKMEQIGVLKDTLVMLSDLKKQPEYHKVTLADNLDIVFTSDGYGGINVTVVLNDGSNVDLTINYQIDQSFLQEMAQLVELLLQDTSTPFMEESQDAFVISESSSLRMQNVTVYHEKAPSESYLRMKLAIIQCFVEVEQEIFMSVDEFVLFKEELKLLRNNKKQRVIIAPLGEFVSIELYSNEKGFWIKGDISDLLMPQSCLSFQNEFDGLAFQQLFEDVLVDSF